MARFGSRVTPRVRAFAAAVTCILVSAACTRDGARVADSGRASIVDTGATPVGDSRAAGPPRDCAFALPPAAQADWRHHVNAVDHLLPNGAPRDLGVGLVVPESEAAGAIHAGAFGVDSLLLRASPDERAPVVAGYVVLSVLDRGVRATCRGFASVADSTLRYRPNLYASGVASLQGMPVDSVTADSVWLRVAFAIDTSFVVRHAWASTRGSARYLSWLALLARAGDSTTIFFADPAARADPSRALHASPEGPPATVQLPRDPAAWTMYLDRVVGDWGEVHLEIGDPCGEGEIEALPGTFWIRLVDDRGRPLVLPPNEGVC